MIPSKIWTEDILPIALQELANASESETIESICERISGRSGHRVTYFTLRSALAQRGLPSASILRARRAAHDVVGSADTIPAPRSSSPAGVRGADVGVGYATASCVDVGRPSVAASPDTSTILVCPDTHAPYHDERAFDCFCEVAEALKPDVIVIIGDFVDCYSVSRFSKSPQRGSYLSTELDVANKLLDRIHAPRVVYTEGNHEVRLADYIARQAKELYGMVSIREALKIDKRGWEWVPYKQSIRIGKMNFTHDVDKWGKYAAQQSLEVYGGNLCFGHTHRGGTVYWGSVIDGDHVCLNVGWLGDVDQVDYRHRDRARIESQTGFGLVRQERDGTTHAQFVPILDGRAIVDGRVIAANRRAA